MILLKIYNITLKLYLSTSYNLQQLNLFSQHSITSIWAKFELAPVKISDKLCSPWVSQCERVPPMTEFYWGVPCLWLVYCYHSPLVFLLYINLWKELNGNWKIISSCKNSSTCLTLPHILSIDDVTLDSHVVFVVVINALTSCLRITNFSCNNFCCF